MNRNDALSAFLATFLVLSSGGQLASGQTTIPAFPGADGAAAYVSGGRDLGAGQIVYHVTKLESAIDDPQRFDFGTLRYGLNNSNFPAGVPRTIVFDVGGVFSLGRLPQSGWDPNGNGWDAQSRLTIGGTNVTLAGQTAPGPGVMLMGGGIKPQGNNNIIRNITVASGYGMRNWWDPGDPFPEPPAPQPTSLGPGIFPDATVFDAMDISGTNLIIDHVSTLYATDETISMNENADNITIQYSNISQSQNYPQWDAEGDGFTGHALGSLLEAGSGAGISFHHNLYAHHKGRVPQTQGGGSGAYYDFRNNVFYNWLGTAGSRRGATFVNLVGNFYLAGDGGDQPIGGTNTGLTTANGGTGVLGGSNVHRSGSLLDSNKDGDADDGVLLSPGGAPHPLWAGGAETYAGATDIAEHAFDRVLNYVGANWWTRDGVIDTPDERIINETRTGTGKIMAWADDPWNSDPNEGQEWRDLVNTPQVVRAADWDTEEDIGYGVGDGMPTHWELQHGLDPHARDDAGDFDSDGYTNLEEYLNEVAAWPAPNAIAFNNAHGDGRFAHILNWDANADAGSIHPWQPSRYDTAIIDNGTVAVDAVGQRAGSLLLATGPGDNATLSISDGWLQVEDAAAGLGNGELIIGADPDATAVLHISGGRLKVETLSKGAGGSIDFSGGVLSADLVLFTLDVQGGTIAPGASAGHTLVVGDLTLDGNSAMEIELGSTTPGQYDQLTVAGDVWLDGTLRLQPLAGYSVPTEPGGVDTFAIILSQDRAGTFGQIMYDGQLLEITSATTTALYSHAGEGLFRIVSYDAEEVLFANYRALPGDANGDLVVDVTDFNIWNAHKFTGGTDWITGDFNGDGVTDVSDFNIWNAHKFSTADALCVVPEPTSFVLFTIAGLTGFSRRWHRSHLSGVSQRKS